MEIKLNKIMIENFKCLKNFEIYFDGDNAVIKGKNGSGKTTVFDTFLWLLFGKNSAGDTQFKMRPLDQNNEPIKGLETVVEAGISIDGIRHTFRKEQHEKTVKGQIAGFETLCFIDSVPKKVGEYQDYIAEIIPENTFKMLTSIRYFNEGIAWKERRKMLLDIAGNIGTPSGFDELIAALNGRTIDDYKTVLTTQKKRHEKDRDEINPRIDEIQRGLENYVENNASIIVEKRRNEIQKELRILQVNRINLAATEKERNEKLELINGLKSDRAERELELRSDICGIKTLLDEKAAIETKVAKHKRTIADAELLIDTKQRQIKAQQNEQERILADLKTVRAEFTEASSEQGESNCYACGQTLPAEKLAENEKKKQTKIASITERGNKLKKTLDDCKAVILTQETELKTFQQNLDKLNSQVAERDSYKAKRFAEIDNLIANRSTIDPAGDKEWRRITAEIEAAEKELGRPISEQITAIDNDATAKNEELEKLNSAMAQSDRMKQDKARIDELKKEEKDLAQKIADVEKQLDEIGRYQAEVSVLIESSVNGKFKFVKFKLFNTLLNGSIEDCCEAIFNGVPYSDCSYGQKVIMGIDIINVLSVFYDYSIPLFIDNAESLTLPIETHNQTIKLFATEISGLQFSKEEKSLPTPTTEPEPGLFNEPVKKSKKKSNKKETSNV